MYSFTAENNTSKEFQHYTTASIIPATTSIATTTVSSSINSASIYTEGAYTTNSHRHEPLYPFNDMLYSLENQHQNDNYNSYNQQHYNSSNFDNQQQYDQQHYNHSYDLQQQTHYQYNLPQTQQHFNIQQQQQPNQWSYPQYYYNHPHHSPQSHVPDTNPSTTLYTVSQNSSSHSLPSQTTPVTTNTTPKTTQQRPRITTSIWDDEGTICYQVDVRGICVARRQDNDMINGTKLLNVTGMSRGKRDGILKNERGRVVVKVGAMHLKGVWVPFARAKSLAIQYNMLDQLHPLFVDEPAFYFYQQPNYASNNPIYLQQQQQQQQSEMLYQQLPNVPSVPSMIPYYNQQENTTLSPHSSSITVMSSSSANLPPF